MFFLDLRNIIEIIATRLTDNPGYQKINFLIWIGH